MAERELAAGGGGDVAMSEDYLARRAARACSARSPACWCSLAVFLMVTKPGA